MLAAPSPVIAIASAAMDHAPADAAEVAVLDLRFQAAVKSNDAAVIDAILHPSYLLVLGDGTRVTREALIEEARSRTVRYVVQDEDPDTQSVMVWGDTAVVTARLHIRGTRDGKAFDRRLWFTDTYVRTSSGWRYAYAQASLPLAPDQVSGKRP